MAEAALPVEIFGDAGVSAEVILPRLAWLKEVVGPRLERFMGYYRNTVTELAAVLPCAPGTSFAVRPFRQFQELGLPARITGFRRAAGGAAVAVGAIDVQRKEVVIENDIGWRINTMVDFAASHKPAINSTARDAQTRVGLTKVIGSIVEAAGGVRLLQDLVLQGAINGAAWVHVRPTKALLSRFAVAALNGKEDSTSGGGAASAANDRDNASMTGQANAGGVPLRIADWLEFEIVAADRLCPLPQGGGGYAAVLTEESEAVATSARGGGLLEKVRGWFSWGNSILQTPQDISFDLFGANYWQRYVRGNLSEQGVNPLGVLPFVRYENQTDPAAGLRVGAAGSGAVDTGLSDVEPLIPLQDELNTRLSDRAYRVTMTSFRMYLGRGIEDFTKRPVGPGQMWATDNPNAAIDVFGGDASMPSEETHITEVREALDKVSGVSPIAAGQIGSKIGNLTSAVALRLTLIALLARTDRKRAALTETLSKLVGMVLGILDRAGVLRTEGGDRGIDINWPSPLPDSDLDRLQEAQMKINLGIPRGTVLAELGYAEVPSETVSAEKAPAPIEVTRIAHAEAGLPAAPGVGVSTGI